MRTILSLVLTVLVSLQWIKLVGSVRNTVDVENIVDGSEKMFGDENLDKYKVMTKELTFSNNKEGCQKAFIKYDNLVNAIDNYVQRFVNLFLIISNLREHKVEDLNEEIIIDLEISITGQDLTYLQGYSKNSKDSITLKNFSKLDAIFSKIARLKERSRMEKVLRSSRSFFGSIDVISVLRNPNFYRVFSFLMIFIAIWTLRRYLFDYSFYIFLIVTVNSFIIWEGLTLYWKKLKETDIKLYVEVLQTKNLEAECDPATATWYNNIINFFLRDRCVQYYQTLAKNAVEEESFFHCVLESYMFYLVRKPVQLFGTCIREFTNEITGNPPWPLNFLVNIPLGTYFVMIAAIFILVLYGKRLRLSFWGAAIEIGNVKTEAKNDKLPVTNNIERAKPFRKLKSWTKSRFQKDCGKRWKSNLKASKSLTGMPKEDVSSAGNSSDTAIINQLKSD